MYCALDYCVSRRSFYCFDVACIHVLYAQYIIKQHCQLRVLLISGFSFKIHRAGAVEHYYWLQIDAAMYLLGSLSAGNCNFFHRLVHFGSTLRKCFLVLTLTYFVIYTYGDECE